MTIPFKHLAEPYSEQYLLMSSIYPLLGILALYLWFCLKAGPHFMRNRKPFELKEALICYNVMQIALNAYFVIKMTFEVLPYTNFMCEPLADASTDYGRLTISLFHLGFIIRLLELPDTVMFVLRKKFSQVSRLHLYHHTLMAFCTWIIVRYIPGGNVWFAGYINSFVHVIMYSYYLCSALNKDNQKNLWWKKYITILQLFQFVSGGVHALQALISDCNYLKFIMAFFVLQSIIFTKLFGEFYIATYMTPNKTPENGNQKLKSETKNSSL